MSVMSIPLNAIAFQSCTSMPTHQNLVSALKRDGFVVLSTTDFSLDGFSVLINQLCKQLTFDPARHYASSSAQTVDAGSDAVGLHIENGNTPMPPDIVSFYSAKSARAGSQTTVCDGVSVLAELPDTLRSRFDEPFTMRRRLPKIIWQRYVATAFGMTSEETVTEELLEQFIGKIEGQSFCHRDNGAIDYCLKIPAIRSDNVAGELAFANALLGPSYNYEAPIYAFADGSPIDESVLATIRAIGERHTQEITWRDGDIAIIDNKRVMHGRRAITVPLAERLLYIAMGLGIRGA